MNQLQIYAFLSWSGLGDLAQKTCILFPISEVTDNMFTSTRTEFLINFEKRS